MIIPAGYYQANFTFSGATLPLGAQFTMGLFPDGFSGTLSDVGDACIASWHDNFVNYQHTDVTFDGVLVKEGPNATGPSVFVTSGFSPTTTGDPLDPNCALLVRKVTDAGGHAGRGRFFVPGLLQSITDEGGKISSSFLSTAQPDMDSFYSDLVGADLQPVLLHGEDSPLSTPNVITTLVIDNQIATQRRRNRR